MDDCITNNLVDGKWKTTQLLDCCRYKKEQGTRTSTADICDREPMTEKQLMNWATDTKCDTDAQARRWWKSCAKKHPGAVDVVHKMCEDCKEMRANWPRACSSSSW